MKESVKPKSASKHAFFSKVIYFYEWSNLFRAPLKFYNLVDFEEFLKECGIPLTRRNKLILSNDYSTAFTTCALGENKLLLSGTWMALRDAVDGCT